MKKFIFIFTGIFISYLAISQDLVVTNNNDSINCKIEKIEGYSIYYSYVRKNRIQNEYVLLKNIRDYEFNHYNYSRIDEFRKNIFNKSPHFSFGVNFGYSYQIGTISPFLPNDSIKYIGSQNKLRSGFNVGANVAYFFPKIFGLGIKSSFFFSSSGNLSSEDYASYKLKQFTSYVGPAIYFRILAGEKNAFVLDLSAGHIHFSLNEKPENNEVVSKNKITGNSLGYSLGLEYNRKLTNYISLGFNTSFTTGHLNFYRIRTSTYFSERYHLNKDPYGNLNRFDFSIVLRFIMI